MFKAIKVYFLKRQYKAIFKEAGVEFDPNFLAAIDQFSKDEIEFERKAVKEGLTKKVLQVLTDDSEENEAFQAGLGNLLSDARRQWLDNRSNNQPTDFAIIHQAVKAYIDSN